MEVQDEWKRIFRNEPPISAYDELKRKNDQLNELSERIQQSEARYKALTNSLPLLIFSLNTEGLLIFANEWLEKYLGEPFETLNQTKWQHVVHEHDYPAFSLLLNNDSMQAVTALKTQVRLRHASSGEFLWHQVSLQPVMDDQKKVQSWSGFLADIHAQKVVEETLKDNLELKQAQQKLEDNQKILERYIEELNRSNTELQQFAYIASHDLQEPIRKILFYSDYIKAKYSDKLDPKGSDYVQNLHEASLRMRDLIHDILFFAQVNKDKMKRADVDLNEVAKEALQSLEILINEKQAAIEIAALPVIKGDKRLLRQLFENIISNSLKYAKKDIAPAIHITADSAGNEHRISFADNGIGFDEKYLPKMFVLFQRLHNHAAYEGTGLGLAICRKIMDIHEGSITANSKENEGATFHISLPKYA